MSTIELTDELRWKLLQVKASQNRAARAFSLLRSKGIEPILIKGIAAGQWYPPFEPRMSIDTDLAVAAEDYQSAAAVVRTPEALGTAIDLHRELRHLDSVPWADLFSNSQLLDIDGTELRVLRPEDHLRVLCIHWLTDGGCDKHRLWDIYYAIDGRPADFDWGRFLGTVSSKRQRWLSVAVGMAERYLDLDLSGTPLEEASSSIPAWVIRTAEWEWKNDRITPLDQVINDRKVLIKELKRRLRPNPIWSTVQMEGSFDVRSPFWYQVGSFFARIGNSYRRVLGAVLRRSTDER